MISERSQENLYIVITSYQESTVRAERRIISYSVEVHQRYQNNTHFTGCIVGKAH